MSILVLSQSRNKLQPNGVLQTSVCRRIKEVQNCLSSFGFPFYTNTKLVPSMRFFPSPRRALASHQLQGPHRICPCAKGSRALQGPWPTSAPTPMNFGSHEKSGGSVEQALWAVQKGGLANPMFHNPDWETATTGTLS